MSDQDIRYYKGKRKCIVLLKSNVGKPRGYIKNMLVEFLDDHSRTVTIPRLLWRDHR